MSALNAVASVSATDVWAVGIDSDQQFNISPLAERWGGASWHHIQSALVGRSAAFYGVAAASPSSAWAVGAQPATPNNSLTGTLIEAWNGAAWSVARSPNPGSAESALVGASELASGFSWAVGDYKNGDGVAHTLVEAVC
jgi:hypothetical protein